MVKKSLNSRQNGGSILQILKDHSTFLNFLLLPIHTTQLESDRMNEMTSINNNHQKKEQIPLIR
jgi:hypothetical protein